MIRLTSMEDMEDIMDGVDGNRCSLPPENSHRDKFNDAIKWLKTVCYDAKSMDAIDILIAAARENPYGRNYADEANRIIAEKNERIAELESMLTVKGEPGEAIKILSNYFTPVGNQNRYSVRQYRECITILESTIADLTEQVRVRDEVIDKLIDDNHPCGFCEHEYGDMDCAESNCPEADDIIKSALNMAKL